MKSRSASAAFSLDASVICDGYLNFWNGQSYDSGSAPGKVDAYRFMSAYLAPSLQNTTDFFSTVVDPQWLANASEDYAVALRQAQSTPNPAWRLLHRVTYVRRVPPVYEIDAVQTPVPDVVAPANVADNMQLIELVQLAIPSSERIDPTPAVLGQAVAEVLATSLASTLPWWTEFLNLSEVAGSSAELTLRKLRHDLLAYMIDLYAAASAEPGLELPVQTLTRSYGFPLGTPGGHSPATPSDPPTTLNR
jgi:hypothetical protein